MKTTDKILQLLKLQGDMTAKALAEALSLTTMGVRQHMQQLENEELVSFEDRKAARGRPARYWALTSQSAPHFANGHEELTLQLINSVKTIFGDEGLDKLISHRETTAFELYQQALEKEFGLLNKLEVLAKLRSNEGYMATVDVIDGTYWLIENHCPICAAAKQCQSFCRSELQMFQALLNDQATINREEYIVDGARRCAYKVELLKSK